MNLGAGTSKTQNEISKQSGGTALLAGNNARQSVHIHHPPNAVGKPDKRSIAKADASLREDLDKYAEKIIGTLPTDLCELEAIVELQSTPEEFGAKGLIRSETSNSTRVTVDELSATANKNAVEEAKSKKFSNKAAFDDHVTRYGNIIALIGSAGIGKTTFAKQYFKHSRDILKKDVRDAITAHDSSYLAFLYLRELDNDKDMSVLEFLTTSTKNPNLNWCQAGLENQLLARMSKSNNLCIVMDGMDESRFGDLSLDAPVIGLYGRAKPVVILQNLLRGDILANAHKLLASRPGAYHKLHPSCKSHFPVRVIGFNENSQNKFFIQICRNEAECEKVQQSLIKNPHAKALCFIPIFAKTIAPYIIKYLTNDSSFTLTDVFAEFVVTRIRSPKFKTQPSILRKLSHLALNGMLNDKFLFDNEELVQVGLDSAVLEDFLHMQINMQVSSTDPDLKILEGDKVFFFIHLLWHEFFAALYLMFVTDLETFSKQLQSMESDELEMVLRFLFGLLNTGIHRKLKPIFRISSADVASKKSLLKDLITSLGSQLSTCDSESFNSKLFKLCSLAQESNDEGIIRSLADSLPGEFRIKGGTILPREVSSLCHVLRATDRELVISIGDAYRSVTFTGNGLEMLMDSMAHTNHKMELVRVDITGSRDFAALSTCVHKINSLVLRNVRDISLSAWKLLTEAIARRETPMELLHLSGNKLGSRGLSCLATSVSNINQLELMNCEIAGSDLQPLTDAISRMDRSMELLNLSGNKLGSRGLSCLATSVSNINQLWLEDCEIAGSDLQPLTDAISRMDRPMELLNLSDNKLGSRGLGCLATSVSNINQLWLEDCEIAGSDLQPLTDAISRMDRPMEVLDLSFNKLGSRGLSCLATSVSNINQLWLVNCKIAGSDLQPLTDAISQMDRPMRMLDLTDIELGSQGLAFLRTCAHNVQQLELYNCGIDEADVDSLREGYLSSDEEIQSSDEEIQSSDEAAESSPEPEQKRKRSRCKVQ